MARQIRSIRVTATGAVNTAVADANGDFTATGPFNMAGATLVAGSDAAKAMFFDNITGAGDAVWEIAEATANDSKTDILSTDGGAGLQFQNGVWVTLTGTSAVLYILYG